MQMKILTKSCSRVALIASLGSALHSATAQEEPSLLPTTTVSSLETSRAPVRRTITPRPAITATAQPSPDEQIPDSEDLVITPLRVVGEKDEQLANITIIDSEKIARTAPLSFDELTRDIPNVTFLGGPRYLGEQLVIRGESGSSVNVRIDDARQNFVSGHAGQRFFVEPDFLSRAEILRGPGSFAYGSGSAGVVSLSTLDPRDIVKGGNEYGFRARSSYHTNSREWATNVVGAVAGEQSEILVGYSSRDGQNINLPDGRDLPFSAVERDSALAKYVFNFDSDNRLEFSLSSYESIDRGGANPQPFDVGTTSNALVDRTIDYLQFSGEWLYNPADIDWINAKTTFFVNETRQERNYAATTGSNAGRQNIHELSSWGIESSNLIEHTLAGRESLTTFGFDYFSETQDGQETRDTFFIPGALGNSSGRPDASADHLGIFVLNETQLSDSFTIHSGLRFDHSSTEKTVGSSASQEFSEWSPQIGFRYEINDQWALFGQYSRAYTAPTLNDLYQDGSHFGVVPSFPFFQTVSDPQSGFIVTPPGAPLPAPGQINVNYFEERFIPNPDLKPRPPTILSSVSAIRTKTSGVAN